MVLASVTVLRSCITHRKQRSRYQVTSILQCFTHAVLRAHWTSLTGETDRTKNKLSPVAHGEVDSEGGHLRAGLELALCLLRGRVPSAGSDLTQVGSTPIATSAAVVPPLSGLFGLFFALLLACRPPPLRVARGVAVGDYRITPSGVPPSRIGIVPVVAQRAGAGSAGDSCAVGSIRNVCRVLCFRPLRGALGRAGLQPASPLWPLPRAL